MVKIFNYQGIKVVNDNDNLLYDENERALVSDQIFSLPAIEVDSDQVAEMTMTVGSSQCSLEIVFLERGDFVSGVTITINVDGEEKNLLTDQFGTVKFDVDLPFRKLDCYLGGESNKHLRAIENVDLNDEDLISVLVIDGDQGMKLCAPEFQVEIGFDGTGEGFVDAFRAFLDGNVNLERNGKPGPMPAKKLNKKLKKLGVIFKRITGDHQVIETEAGLTSVVPLHTKDIATGTYLKILKDLDISWKTLAGV